MHEEESRAMAGAGRRAGWLAAALALVAALPAAGQSSQAELYGRLTAALDEMPGSYSQVRSRLEGGDPGPIRSRRILFDEVNDRITGRVIAHVRANREAIGLYDDARLAEFESGMSAKIRGLFTLNVIDNSLQAWFDLVAAGGSLSDCAAPDFRTHRTGVEFTVCVQEASEERAVVRIIANGRELNAWHFRAEPDGFALVDLAIEVNDDLLLYLAMAK